MNKIENDILQLIKQVKETNEITLDLSGQKLTTLPPEIKELTHLEILKLENNALRGFPIEITYLTSLKKLYLKGNMLTVIPPEIENLFNLEWLEFNENQLKGLPEEMEKLTNLKWLDLSVNLFNEIPHVIWKLSQLEGLSIVNNTISKLSFEIVDLKNLWYLNLCRNPLERFPLEICNLVNLKSLYLNITTIKEIPEQIKNLVNLEQLHLHANQLKTLPPEIGDLANLTVLDVHTNQLRELPINIGKISNLKELVLTNNKLIAIPSEIGNLTNLEKLIIGTNYLEVLPVEIGNLIALEELHLVVNRIKVIPSEIGNLRNLKILNLTNNQLEFLPDNIRNLENLQLLFVNNNKLKSIPLGMNKLINLEILDLQNNNLNIPFEIISQTGEPQNIINYYNNQFKQYEKKVEMEKYLHFLEIHNSYIPIISGENYLMDNISPMMLGKEIKQRNILEREKNRERIILDNFRTRSKQSEEREIREVEIFHIYDAINKNNHILIKSGPGSGKTVLLQYIVYKKAQKMISENYEEIEQLPLYLPLRDWGKKKSDFLEYIEDYYKNSGLSKEFFEDLKKYIRQGKVLLLLDGLDEILDRPEFIETLSNFVNGLGKNCKFIITTRFIRNENNFTAWEHYELIGFIKEQKRKFVEVYFSKNFEKVAPFIEFLQANPPIEELASNPLILTFLCIAYDKQEIKLTGKSFDLYREITTKILREYCNLKYSSQELLDGSIRILEKVALEFFSRGKNIFSYEEISSLLEEKDLTLFQNMAYDTGLLKEEDYRSYSFSHQIFYDFFTVSALAKREDFLQIIEEFLLLKGNLEKEFILLLFDTLNVDSKVSMTNLLLKYGYKIGEIKEIEDEARKLIQNKKYSEARTILKQIIEEFPERKLLLENEFGFLYDFTLTPEENKKLWEENKEVLEWRTNLWYILSEKNNFPLGKKEKVINETEEKPINLNDSPVNVEDGPEEEEIIITSQEKGDKLERAVIKLFQQFFEIAEEHHEILLKWLRKQKSGTQGGTDLSFECNLPDNKNIKCHIECKNYKEGKLIKPIEITPKLAQSQTSYLQIDHWVLISPHADPNNDVKNLLAFWEKNDTYPFKIHIWSPESRVKDFFYLSPPVYAEFYPQEKEAIQQKEWSEAKRYDFYKYWKDQLKPLTRLPEAWDNYIRNPYFMCIKDEESKKLEELYQNYVSMSCIDERSNIINKSIEEHIREWLNDNNFSIKFLLGDFGDGKTAFTYILSRKLAEEFLEDPINGWIPIRFGLQDYYTIRKDRFDNMYYEGTSEGFLERRFKRFDATLGNWVEIKKDKKILAILDGFDEMSKELTLDTITENIQNLGDCCKEFRNLKILITSRTHFFENQQNEELLLEYLPCDKISKCYLAPIEPKDVLKHLESYAKTSTAKDCLRSMENSHDFIDFGSKPLFLQMIKETLLKAEKDVNLMELNAITLYEEYINQALERKKLLLKYDKNIRLGLKTIIEKLKIILEKIALKIQKSGINYISLTEFSDTEQNFAELLWEYTQEGEDESVTKEYNLIEEDAKARVAVRSLLKRIDSENATERLVDLCHRSVREFFVAQGICHALKSDNIENIEELLTGLPINNEIFCFTSEIMKRDSLLIYENQLLDLVKIIREKPGGGANFSKNVINLLFRLKGELPGDDWSGLNFDETDLTGADLSNKNFFGSSLQNAKLNNVNFEGADFRNCNLTGARIEETTPVLALVKHPVYKSIIAVYKDNTIWEWKNIDSAWKRESQIIGKNIGKTSINQVGIRFGSDLFALTNNEVILYDYKKDNKVTEKARFGIKPDYKNVVIKRDSILLFSEEQNKILLIDLNDRKIINSIETIEPVYINNFDLENFVVSDQKSSLYIKNPTIKEDLIFDVKDVKTLSTYCVRENESYLLGCGLNNGEVLLWQLYPIANEKPKLIFKEKIHVGMVSTLTFFDSNKIITGGIDRKIMVIQFDLDSQKIIDTKKLQVTMKCKGMKIEGIKSDKEKKLLEELLCKASILE